MRAHEQAHLSAAGPYARGGPHYEYETGPDKRRYAVGGEVDIDTAPVPDDPEATIRKAQVVRRAALAPSDPSPQDRRVAAEASRMEARARQELARQRAKERRESAESAGGAGASIGPGGAEGGTRSGATERISGSPEPRTSSVPSLEPPPLSEIDAADGISGSGGVRRLERFSPSLIAAAGQLVDLVA